ncbi:hypothetical protein FHW58_001303 [Duganella sp. 1224]|uniref:hypothetical protein n=1 Tax=Duganella sp. 1224 TaxID=2587052 RepID=UPI0015CDE7ED|nr:hypothetical protein [Duganella sp. 1224]NYE60151.1 hypothetical protein [Duganella sp. 1224]
MLQYLIQIHATTGAEHSISLSHEDLGLIRAAPPGRPISLENYIAYLTSEQTLALSRRPAHEESVVVCYQTLCRKLAEAEIEAGERGGG